MLISVADIRIADKRDPHGERSADDCRRPTRGAVRNCESSPTVAVRRIASSPIAIAVRRTPRSAACASPVCGIAWRGPRPGRRGLPLDAGGTRRGDLSQRLARVPRASPCGSARFGSPASRSDRAARRKLGAAVVGSLAWSGSTVVVVMARDNVHERDHHHDDEQRADGMFISETRSRRARACGCTRGTRSSVIAVEVVLRLPAPVAAGRAVVERLRPAVEDRLADRIRRVRELRVRQRARDRRRDLVGARRERRDVVDAARQLARASRTRARAARARRPACTSAGSACRRARTPRSRPCARRRRT